MPIVRSFRRYTRPNGRDRFIKLHGSYCNMLARIRGQVRTGRSGLPIWAGAHGYSRVRCSLDRERSHLGYIRSNLRWVTCLENSTFAKLAGSKKLKQLAAQRRAKQSAVSKGCRL